MSVTCILYGASDDEIRTLLREPQRIHEFIRSANPVEQPGCLGALLGKRPRLLPPARPILNIGKSWEAIHYVLNGTTNDVPWPHGFLIGGGSEVGDEDVGYGPARTLWSSDVSAVAAVLRDIEDESFRGRIDPAEMTSQDVYGAPLTDSPEDSEFLVADFVELRAFVVQRSQSGEGLVIQYV